MPTTGFKPTVPASERSQTHILDRTATGIDPILFHVRSTFLTRLILLDLIILIIHMNLHVVMFPTAPSFQSESYLSTASYCVFYKSL
jgi:hypothetical protein